MKSKYRLFKRGKIFYSEDSVTRKQQSLHTSDPQEAQRLIAAKNEAVNHAQFTLAIGHTYLAITDAEILTRTWKDVMEIISLRGIASTQDRCCRALKMASFQKIKNKAILQTTAADFLSVLSDGKQTTRHYLKLLQSAAIDLGWLAGRTILNRKAWRKITPKPKRAITWEEHCAILDSEKSHERRLYLEILWETGASQTDASLFSSENIDSRNNTFVYQRKKTGQQAAITIGKRLKEILNQLPSEGLFFPKLATLDSVARAAEFNRRCKIVGILGVSLHSYRYSWAERGFKAGYPERFAQAALGHGSNAIHHAYAKRAKVICPPLEDYEGKIVRLPDSTKRENTPKQQNA